MRTETLGIPALAAEFTAAHPELDRSQQGLTDGFEYGRLYSHARFGEVLEEGGI